MKKFCYLFCLIFVFSLFFTPNTLGFASAEDVTSISDVYGLTQIYLNPNGNYILENDIDLRGQNFEPIENFTGVFDGNGHTISNFTINKSSGNIGFFANTNGAKIFDVRFQKAVVLVSNTLDTYTTKVGIVAGLAQNTTFDNVSIITSTITSSIPSLQYVGSLAGQFQNGSRAQNITVDSTINLTSTSTKEKYIGGLFGSIDNSQSLTTVVDVQFVFSQLQNSYIGGAYGIVVGNKTQIKNIIINVENAQSGVYGIAGLISYPYDVVSNGEIGFIYTTVSGDYFSNTQNLLEAFSKGEITFDVSKVVAKTVTPREIMMKAFYSQTAFDGRYAWDFNDVWQIEETLTLPYLQNFSSFSYEVDKQRSFEAMAQAPTVDAITILPSTTTYTYGSSINISGYINTTSQMNMFFEISGLRKDDNVIFTNDSVLSVVENENAKVEQVDDNTTTYTLNGNTVTVTNGTVNNNAGTWYKLNNSNIMWGVYSANDSMVNVYQIDNCTQQNSGTYSFVVNAIEYNLIVRTEDKIQGLVTRGTLQNVPVESIEDTISYGETLRYVASPANDFGFMGWVTSLEAETPIYSSNLTLSVLFNESLFAENGLFGGMVLGDEENKLVVYATFTKNVCDITFTFSVNNEVTTENLTNIYIGGVMVTPNEDGSITYKQPMNTPISISFELPAGYDFDRCYDGNGAIISTTESFTLPATNEENRQLVLAFTKDDNLGGGMGYIWWIIGGSVAGILLVGFIVFIIVKKRKDNSYKKMYY